MGCPVHVWAPMMAAAVPFARVARDRLRAARDLRRPRSEAPREMKRWAPVDPHRPAGPTAEAAE